MKFASLRECTNSEKLIKMSAIQIPSRISLQLFVIKGKIIFNYFNKNLKLAQTCQTILCKQIIFIKRFLLIAWLDNRYRHDFSAKQAIAVFVAGLLDISAFRSDKNIWLDIFHFDSPNIASHCAIFWHLHSKYSHVQEAEVHTERASGRKRKADQNWTKKSDTSQSHLWNSGTNSTLQDLS
jgi:hypothetical protein